MPEPREVEWLTLGQYYPTGSELLVLLTVALQLLLGGYLLKVVLIDKHRLVPIKWATVMLLVAVGVLVIQTRLMLPGPAAPERFLTVLFWCLIFALAPMFFYIKTFLEALSEQSTQRLSPMGAEIDDFSEFGAARKLAQKGDIDGAVMLYRGYRENRPRALLEAARLLRTEERYAQAVALFQEISERFPENKPVWGEATYNLAKLMETNLNQPVGAMQYLQQIKRRVPETKYAQMADSDLARLQVMTGKKITELESVIEEEQAPGRPDIAKIQIPTYDREYAAQDLLDAPIPDKDPFLTRDIYTVRGAKAEPATTAPIHRAVAKKSATKTRSASRAKTAKKAGGATSPNTAITQAKKTKSVAPVKVLAVKVKTKAKAKTKARATAAKTRSGTAARTAPAKAAPRAKTSTLAKKKAAARKKKTSRK